MERLRTFALSIALSLLATGCYTQLRAPHQEQHYSEYVDTDDDCDEPVASHGGYDDHVHHPPVYHRPHYTPVFHLPRYDHHDWWLYGDTYCEIWVDRYYDYHPWVPRIDTHIHIGGSYNHHGPHRHRDRHRHRHAWHGRYIKIKPRWRHFGPRFQPASPTINVDIEVNVVERRKRFRRDGFAGGIPERAGRVATTMSVGSVTHLPGDIQTVTRTVRVTRPRKFDRTLTRASSRTPTVSNSTVRTDEDEKWNVWSKGVRTPDKPEDERLTTNTWKDPGRNTGAGGPASSVDEKTAKQPKAQTNWFNPNKTVSSKLDGSTAQSRWRERAKVSDGWKTPEQKEKSGKTRADRASSSESKPANTWSKSDKTSRPAWQGGKEVRRDRASERQVTPSDPKPATSWKPAKTEKPKKPTRSWNPPETKRSEPVQERRRVQPPKVTRKKESKPSSSWTPPKPARTERREKPKQEWKPRKQERSSSRTTQRSEPRKTVTREREERKSTPSRSRVEKPSRSSGSNYSAPKKERRQEVKRSSSSSSSSSSKSRKSEPKKETRKKETKKKDEEKRTEKRRTSRRRAKW